MGCCARLGHGDLRCERCGGGAHRRCLDLASGSYPGGWFQCARCLLRGAGLQPASADGYVVGLARRAVALAGSAVAASSADTYGSHRRRFLRFCTEVLRLPEAEVFPPGPTSDINTAHVCLFIAHASSRLAPATLDGTLSALADWQRSRGIPAADTIRRDPAVQRTLAQAKRQREDGPPSGARAKPPLPLSLVRLLLGWLQSTGRADPASAAERTQDACWLSLGFFGMLRRSELAGLRIGDVEQLAGGGIALRIARSKTDQQGRGATVHIAGVSGSGVAVGCIVARHLGRAGAQGAGQNLPLFARGAVWGSRVAGFGKGDFTRRLRALVVELRAAYPHVLDAEMDFTAHSLRRGGATTAAAGGASLLEIKRHGRWRSDAVEVYVQPSIVERMRVTGSM